jgi:hypothetical protein
MRWCIPHSQRSSYHCPSLGSTWCVKTLWHLLRCIRDWTRLCTHARPPRDCIGITGTQSSWIELSYSWPRTSSCHPCPKNLETSSNGSKVSYIYWPQKPQIYLYTSRFEYEAKSLVRTAQGLWFRGTLSSRHGQCRCGCPQSQSTLFLLIRWGFQRNSLLGNGKA